MNAQDLKKPSETNWARVSEMADEDIDASDIPPLEATFFANARLRVAGKKVSWMRTCWNGLERRGKISISALMPR
jgi:hypothetical protein